MGNEEKVYFPCFRYHISNEPTIFYTQEELDAAGEGWVDNPDKVHSVPNDGGEEIIEVAHAESDVDEVPAETSEPAPAPEEGVDPEIPDTPTPDINILRARAKELGLSGNIKRWKRATLERKITEAETPTKAEEDLKTDQADGEGE